MNGENKVSTSVLIDQIESLTGEIAAVEDHGKQLCHLHTQAVVLMLTCWRHTLLQDRRVLLGSSIGGVVGGALVGAAWAAKTLFGG